MAICLELSIGRLDMEHRGSVGASMENWEVDLSLPQHTASLYVRGRLTVQREPRVTGYRQEKGEWDGLYRACV